MHNIVPLRTIRREGFVITDMGIGAPAGPQDCQPEPGQDLFLIEHEASCGFVKLTRGELVQQWMEHHKFNCTAKKIAIAGALLPPREQAS